MEGKNEGGENPSRGNDWEVVSLTASTYAAAPGPEEVDQKDDDNSKAYGEDEAETSHALFMSRHFVFPPSQHENLPLETVNSEILDSHVGKNVASELGAEGGRSSSKNEEIWPPKGLDESEEFPGIQLFDGEGKNGKEFEESTTLQDFSDKEQTIYSTATLSSFHNETALGGSTTYGEDLGFPEVNEPSERGLDFPTDVPLSPKAAKDDDDDLPCDAWWKRRAASLYAHAKEANAFWSIFVAAAVMGIVILGQRWQQERWQALQLKWQASINNEKSGRILGPITRLKDVIVGGNRRGSFTRGSSSSDH